MNIIDRIKNVFNPMDPVEFRRKNTFTFYENEEATGNPTRHQRNSPETVDFTESLRANSVLTKQLYHNSYPGMKLAGALAYPIVAVPVFFMGFPFVEVPENENIELDFESIIDRHLGDMQSIHTIHMRDGTCWVWPKYDRRHQRVVWEFINDATVSDIIRDLETGEVIEIYTDEMLKVKTGYNKEVMVRRIRRFSKTRIDVQYTGGILPAEIKSYAMRNVLGILPINFSNNKDADEIRGHSDYERVLSDLKIYHDISLAEATDLSKFKTKIVNGTDDVEQWAKNNGFSNKAEMWTDFDLATIDMLFYRPNVEEKPEFLTAQSLVDNYDTALKRIFHKIVEGGSLPEIIWGLKTEGNMASVEENMSVMVKHVDGKRRQLIDPYSILMKSTFQLESMATFGSVIPEMNIEWNNLDAVSDKTRSEIFRNMSQGIAALVKDASISKKQLFYFWQENYPSITDDKLEDWWSSVGDMIKHIAANKADYIEIGDGAGEYVIDPNGERPEDNPLDESAV